MNVYNKKFYIIEEIKNNSTYILIPIEDQSLKIEILNKSFDETKKYIKDSVRKYEMSR